MPLYKNFGGPIWNNVNAFGTFREYYANQVDGYVDDSTKTPTNPLGDVNGKINSLVQEWLDSGVVPEELQQIWLIDQAWQIGNEF